MLIQILSTAAVLAGLLWLGLVQLASLEYRQVTTTMQAMRSGLQFEEAHLIAANRAASVSGLVGANPVRFLSPIPPNYAGAHDPDKDGGLSCGKWFFNEARAALGYQPCYAQQSILSGDTRPLPGQIWVSVVQEPDGKSGVRLAIAP